MSTPDQPDSPQLTRRQLREMRNTASTPIITPEDLADAEAEATAASEADAAPVVAPLPRAAEPTAVADAPPPATEVDLDSPALTRRRARQQERIRTASVPIVTEFGPVAAVPVDATPALAEAAVGVPEGEPAAQGDVPSEVGAAAEDDSSEDAEAPVAHVDEAAVENEAEQAPRPVIAPTFGSGLLTGHAVEVELPASFDQLLSRGSGATGSAAATNALILSQTPETGSFASPVTATGEVLITGTFNLPDHFGSTGTVPGTADGKDVDAVLVDGELPASSSPTPIAASAAISTIKSAEDIIKPPAPEKGGRLMLALVITAGALALALTGVLIVALVTGAFS
ncbi:hypothetical protein [uncultured Microbacterium sp.]|uniref:hypothetical protein n=1 Tax=uncultured Microbacterium sp. TaxID=191216 RepID=UPI00261DF3E7|nr:hypothetical protein [uncultured Microbacterium sp.]